MTQSGPNAPFNEESLRQDIIATWGPAGAHIDVYDHLLSLARVYSDLEQAVAVMSPSAVYDARREAIARINEANPEKKPQNEITGWRPRWWDNYPLGHVVAFAIRAARLAGIEIWEEDGERLPDV
jgi:hypothetical protein